MKKIHSCYVPEDLNVHINEIYKKINHNKIKWIRILKIF